MEQNATDIRRAVLMNVMHEGYIEYDAGLIFLSFIYIVAFENSYDVLLSLL